MLEKWIHPGDFTLLCLSDTMFWKWSPVVDTSTSDNLRYREQAYICFHHFSAHLHAKIEQILSRIFTKLSILCFLNSSQRIYLKSEFHSLWSHFTMHRWVSTVLTYKAFSLQCNTRILFKDDIFYLWILFRGKKWTFNSSFKCAAWLLS